MSTPKRPKTPGKGYRFLSKAEVESRSGVRVPPTNDIERYRHIDRSWSRGWLGDCPDFIYRIKKPRGFFLIK